MGQPDDLTAEVNNNIKILMDGSGVLQPKTAKNPQAQGSDKGAFAAREQQLHRAAQRLGQLAGDTDAIKVDDIKRLSGLNLPDSVTRELAPLLERIAPKLEVKRPTTPQQLRDDMATKMTQDK